MKYADHNPLYRQSVILLCDAGIDISRATLCGWVMTVGEMLYPVVGVMRRELLAGIYIQADETPVDVQAHDKHGKNHQACLWQYGSPGKGVLFDFRMSRGREGPARFMDKFEGILLTDGYAAYDRGVGSDKQEVLRNGRCISGPVVENSTWSCLDLLRSMFMQRMSSWEYYSVESNVRI